MPNTVTVYDKDGNAFEKAPIDARESVESGFYSYSKDDLPQPDEASASKAEEGREQTASVSEPTSEPETSESPKRGRRKESEQ